MAAFASSANVVSAQARPVQLCGKIASTKVLSQDNVYKLLAEKTRSSFCSDLCVYVTRKFITRIAG